MYVNINKIIIYISFFFVISLLILTGCSTDKLNLSDTNGTAVNKKIPPSNSTTPKSFFSPTPYPKPYHSPIPKSSEFPIPTPSPTSIPKTLDYSVLKNDLENYIAKQAGKYGVYFIDLTDGQQFGINATDEYIAASTSKLPMNLLLFKKIAAGEIDPQMKLTYTEKDFEPGSGIIQKQPFGTEYTVLETAELSVVYSDNCAINMIIRLLGIENIRKFMHDIGGCIYYGPRHRSCPKDMALYMQEFYKFYLENPDIAGILMHNLENTIFHDRIDKLLPKNVRVAHKIGTHKRTANDVGIVFAKRPYILSIMSDDVDFHTGCDVLAQISKKVYDFIEKSAFLSTPALSPIPIFSPTPTILPQPTPTPPVNLDISAISYKLFNGRKAIPSFSAKDTISFGIPDDYSDIEGITTFRGNHYRNSACFGTPKIKEKKLEIIWKYDIGKIDIWPGVGWTGQPLLIHWPENIRRMMNIKDNFKNKDLVEVIYATLDGNIYFLDMKTGLPTRDPINIGVPIKGTPAIDPRGYPILYTGQGLDINKDTDTYVPFRYRIFSLLDQKLLFSFLGIDSVALRKWGAFDSSGLIDKKTDTLIECGENGLVYRIKLNTNFDKKNHTLSLKPEIIKYRYNKILNGSLGIENSPVFYHNLMFFADNSGLLQCLDINTLKPLWIADLKDDTDSSIVLEETAGGVFLYTANEVDIRCRDNKKDKAYSSIRKFNALTGELIWQKDYLCFYNSNVVNGGVLSTPVIGKNDISDRVIYIISKTGTPYGGRIVALDKNTGREIWSKVLKFYSWSSPVDFYASDGKTYIIFCDYGGYLYLLDPKNGKILDKVFLGANIEGSPAIYGNTIVVGSYAKKIFGIQIK